MKLDAAVVGAGPNGLAAALVLASHGLAVRVFEAADEPGGGARTEELTRPGVLHDVCSAVHPLGAGSPLFRALPLEAQGLEWVHPPICAAHPLDDRPAALLVRSLEETAAGLGRDEAAYRRLFGPLVASWDEALPDLLAPLGPTRGMRRLVPWVRAARSARSLARGAFGGERARALFAGMAAHSILPFDRPLSAGVGLVLTAAGHAAGWPFPRGGSGALTASLVRLLERLGGEVVTGHRVGSMLDLPPARATLLDLAPPGVLEVLRGMLPPGYARRLGRHPFGPGVFKLDLALSGPIPWMDPRCARAGTVHVGGTFAEVAASERAAFEGRPNEAPFVLLAQPGVFDPTRAPQGTHPVWAYCHVPRGFTGDASGAIEAQIERFAPGFRDLVVARATLSPRELERRNANLVGGDIAGGELRLHRLFLGPGGRPRPYRTPLPDVFICSASTPPGAGVHGMCGFHAARDALARRFGVRVPRDPARALGPALEDLRE